MFADYFLSSLLPIREYSRPFAARPHECNHSLGNSDADVKALLKAHLYPGATDAQVDSVADQYSEDPAAVCHSS